MLVTVARCDGGFVRHLHTTLHYNHTTTTVRKQKDMKGANQFTFSFALFYPDSPELLAKSGVDRSLCCIVLLQHRKAILHSRDKFLIELEVEVQNVLKIPYEFIIILCSHASVLFNLFIIK